MRDKTLGNVFNLRYKLKILLAETLGIEPEDIDEEALFRRDLGLEGSQLSDFLDRIKEEFEIEVPIEDLAEVETTGEFLDLVESYSQEEV